MATGPIGLRPWLPQGRVSKPMTIDAWNGEPDFTVAPIVEYPLSAATGTSDAHIIDVSGYGRNGVAVGSPTRNTNYVSFNGTNYVDLPVAATLAAATQITFQCWFRKTGTALARLFGEATSVSGTTRFGVFLTSGVADTGIQLFWRNATNDPSGTAMSAAATVAIPLNTWHALTIQWDAAAGRYRAWAGATLIMDNSAASNGLGVSATAGLSLGRLYGNATNLSVADVARFRLYRRIITDDERTAFVALGAPT